MSSLGVPTLLSKAFAIGTNALLIDRRVPSQETQDSIHAQDNLIFFVEVSGIDAQNILSRLVPPSTNRRRR